ncbi:MAG: hypothetical protein ACYDCM_04160 [Candidatus Acidiferrales bacterium]
MATSKRKFQTKMVIKVSWNLAVLFLIFNPFPTFSQTPGTPPSKVTFAQVAASTKNYFRDTAELPLLQTVEFSATDPSGRTLKHKTGSVKYLFNGYNPRSQKAGGTVTASVGLFGDKTLLYDATTSTVALYYPISILVDANNLKNSTAIGPATGSQGGWIARVPPFSAHCGPMAVVKHLFALKNMCGSSEFHFGKDDLSLRHYSFEAAGSPAPADLKPFGKCTILHFHIDADFQKILLTGDPKSFVIPKQVVTILATDKGTIFIKSQFAPKK